MVKKKKIKKNNKKISPRINSNVVGEAKMFHKNKTYRKHSKHISPKIDSNVVGERPKKSSPKKKDIPNRLLVLVLLGAKGLLVAVLVAVVVAKGLLALPVVVAAAASAGH